MASQDTRVGRVGHEPEVTIGTDQREAIGSDSIPFSDRVVGVDHPVLWLTNLRWLTHLRWCGSDDPDHPAQVPDGVPELPDGVRVRAAHQQQQARVSEQLLDGHRSPIGAP